jgi:uncharacterized protein
MIVCRTLNTGRLELQCCSLFTQKIVFLDFFLLLRQHALPVTLSEYLTLLAVLRSEVGGTSVEEFYFLSKATLIKHEQHLDLFDRLFDEYVNSRPASTPEILPTVPPDWLVNALQTELTDDERAALEALGGLDELWSRFRQLLDEQTDKHEAGSQFIGTGGTSPFGSNGENPVGFKLTDPGQPKPGERGNRSGTKIWQQRAYRNLDDDLDLNTRNLKLALRRLRILTRDGIENELDIDGTIDDTSRNAGLLDIRMRPSRKNKVKVLLLLDVGGSMDEHIELCSQLFSAARYQFKQLEILYFHNCIYETLWRDNDRRSTRTPTWEVLHKYNQEYKVIFVGDAAMSPYEITEPRGSVEHYNDEAGLVWLERFRQQYKHIVWLNPNVAAYWQYTHSTQLIRNWSGDRMFPLTINGLTLAMKSLKNPKITFQP